MPRILTEYNEKKHEETCERLRGWREFVLKNNAFLISIALETMGSCDRKHREVEHSRAFILGSRMIKVAFGHCLKLGCWKPAIITQLPTLRSACVRCLKALIQHAAASERIWKGVCHGLSMADSEYSIDMEMKLAQPELSLHHLKVQATALQATYSNTSMHSRTTAVLRSLLDRPTKSHKYGFHMSHVQGLCLYGLSRRHIEFAAFKQLVFSDLQEEPFRQELLVKCWCMIRSGLQLQKTSLAAFWHAGSSRSNMFEQRWQALQ